MQVNKNGKVRLYLIKQDKWIERFPIDAAEILAAGIANTTGNAGETEPSNVIEISEAEIKKMSAKQLLDFVKEKSIDIDLTVEEKLADKRQALIDFLAPDDEEDEDED